MYKIILACCLGVLSFSSCDKPKDNLYLFVGSYSEPTEPGIKVYQFDQETGKTSLVSSISDIKNPSYLALSADKNRLYAVSEAATPDAAICAFQFDPEKGILTAINEQATQGSDPCYVYVDPKREAVITANYSGGSISFFPLNADGSVQPLAQLISFDGESSDAENRKPPHLHGIFPSPDNLYLFATDLGLDRIYSYQKVTDSTGKMTGLDTTTYSTLQLKAGEGPRHMAFHPNGKYAYVLGELSGNITAMTYADGKLDPFQSVEADSLHAAGSADIHLSPDGRFLYASNRLQGDGLAIFSVNPADGTLTKTGYQLTGKHPRNFIITPNGRYLLCASRDDNTIQVFSIDQASGLLKDTNQVIESNKPVCLKFISINE